MSLQMLLEGPDLDGILREVEANYGREFRVIQAEQVRSGGMGGFFAKQHYEVTIEISDPDIIAGINAQKKKSDIPLTELATRSQNDQAAASTQEWARDLLKQASELNSNQPVDTSTEEPARKSSLPPLLHEDDIAAHETSRWTRTLGRLSGKKNDSRPPSDRMLTATSDQQSRLRDLLSSGGGVDDEEVSTTPAESTPTVQTAPVSTPDRDGVEDEVPPAARVVADMEPHSIPGVRKNTGARAEMASSTLRTRTEKTSDSQAQPSHASMPSPAPIAAGPEAPERSAEPRIELDIERVRLQDERDELLAYRGDSRRYASSSKQHESRSAKATELNQEEEEARARVALGQESIATNAERQRVEELMTALAQQQQQLSDRQEEMQIQASEMDTREATIVAREEALAGLSDDRAHRESELQGKLSDVVAASAKLEREWEELKAAQSALSEQRCSLLDLEKSLEERETSRGTRSFRNQLAESEREFQTRQEAWTSHQEQIDAEMKDAKEHVDRLLANLNAQQDQLNVRENDLQDRWSILEAKESDLTARDEALKSRASQADDRDSELDARAREISSFIDEVQRDRKDLSQRRAAVEAFEVEVDGRGERVRLLEEQVAEQRAAVESGRQELALAQDELAAARVSLEQEFEAKSADVESREAAAREQIVQAEAREQEVSDLAAQVQSREGELRSQINDVASVTVKLERDRIALDLAEDDLSQRRAAVEALRLRLMVVVSRCGFWRSRLPSSGLRWSRSAGTCVGAG